MRARHVKGFTLVEILVVVGIIALLVAILLPTLNKARDQANRVACMSNIRQLGMAAINYAQTNKGVLPIEPQRVFLGQQYLFLDTFRADMFTLMGFGQRTVAPSTKYPEKVWQCPSAVDAWKVNVAPSNFVDVDGRPVNIIRTSYMYLGAGSTLANNSWENDPTRRPHKINEKPLGKFLGRKVLFSDEISYTQAAGATLSVVDIEGWRINHPPRKTRTSRVNGTGQEGLVEGANQVFLDGHAEWVTGFSKILKHGRNVGNQTPLQILLNGPGGNAIATQVDNSSSYLALESWWW